MTPVLSIVLIVITLSIWGSTDALLKHYSAKALNAKQAEAKEGVEEEKEENAGLLASLLGDLRRLYNSPSGLPYLICFCVNQVNNNSSAIAFAAVKNVIQCVVFKCAPVFAL